MLTANIADTLSYKKCKNKLTHFLLKEEKQYYHDLLNKHKDNMRKSWGNFEYIIHKKIKKKPLRQSKFQLADADRTSDKRTNFKKNYPFLWTLVQL